LLTFLPSASSQIFSATASLLNPSVRLIQSIHTANMGYTDVDTLAINTIRVLAVSLLPLPTEPKNPAPAESAASRCPAMGADRMVFCQDTTVALRKRQYHGLLLTSVSLARLMRPPMPTRATRAPQCKHIANISLARRFRTASLTLSLGAWPLPPTSCSTRS
jgi:hypothetical protein